MEFCAIMFFIDNGRYSVDTVLRVRTLAALAHGDGMVLFNLRDNAEDSQPVENRAQAMST
jgi:hypothetical protein